MSLSPILPEHPADFWTKKWLLGVVLPVPVWLYGSYSILTRHSYAMEMRNHWVPVVGWQAVFAGIFLVGLGLVLFSNSIMHRIPAGFRPGVIGAPAWDLLQPWSASPWLSGAFCLGEHPKRIPFPLATFADFA